MWSFVDSFMCSSLCLVLNSWSRILSLQFLFSGLVNFSFPFALPFAIICLFLSAASFYFCVFFFSSNSPLFYFPPLTVFFTLVFSCISSCFFPSLIFLRLIFLFISSLFLPSHIPATFFFPFNSRVVFFFFFLHRLTFSIITLVSHLRCFDHCPPNISKCFVFSLELPSSVLKSFCIAWRFPWFL